MNKVKDKLSATQAKFKDGDRWLTISNSVDGKFVFNAKGPITLTQKEFIDALIKLKFGVQREGEND